MPDLYGRMKRNLTSELIEGSTDGALKKHRPDTSNVMLDASDPARSLLGARVNSFDYSTSDPNSGDYAHGYVRGA